MLISRKVTTAVAAAAAAGCALRGSVAVATASAQAAPTGPGTTSVSVSVPLRFAGYDPVRAAEHGYEVRTDTHGLQYAVPAATPTGSEEGATPTFDPATGRLTFWESDRDGYIWTVCGPTRIVAARFTTL